MERLLKKEHLENLEKGFMCGTELQINCMKKLAEYENTGLQPSEVLELRIDKENTEGLYVELIDLERENWYANKRLQNENEQLKQQLKEAYDYIDTDECTKREYYQKVDEEDLKKEKLIKKLKKQLAEKDKLLENAICPKFKTGDEVWGISNNGTLFNCKVIQHIIENKVDDVIFCGWYYDHSLFATEQEAKQKLEELNAN